MKQKLFPVVMVLCAFLFTLSACVGVQRFETGLPASAGDKFFFHMDLEAKDRGYPTSRHQNSQTGRHESLTVTVPKGTLTYDINDSSGGIDLVVNLKETNEVPEKVIEANIQELKALSDELVDAASKRAEKANVFD